MGGLIDMQQPQQEVQEEIPTESAEPEDEAA